MMGKQKKAEELIPVSMEIILHAGNARNIADDAFRLAKQQDFDGAAQKMEEADKEMVLAHNSQTSVIQGEAQGVEYEYSPLFAHAQDTLMTITSELLTTNKLIDVLQLMFAKKE